MIDLSATETSTAAENADTDNVVTIVICTFNRAERIGRAVQSLQGLQLPPNFTVDIVVVDNASTDATAETVQQLIPSCVIPTRVVYEGKQGVAHARNRGIAEAKGRWVAFFDDDQQADLKWLSELLATAARRQTGCVGGAVRLSLPAGNERLSRVCRILLSETPADIPESPYQDPRTPGSGNLLLDRRFLDQQPFDPNATFGGEDTTLYRQLRSEGVTAWFSPTAIIYHVVPAERLAAGYLIWNARRTGVHVADIEHRHYGKGKFALRMLARLVQAGLKFPRIAWRYCGASGPEEQLGSRCLIAAAGGYCRRTAQWYLPGCCRQEAYFRSLDFRSEREQFGT